MLTTLERRFVAFLTVSITWLLTRLIGCWSAVQARLRICLYLWPGHPAAYRGIPHTPRRPPLPPLLVPTSSRSARVASSVVQVPRTGLADGAAAPTTSMLPLLHPSAGGTLTHPTLGSRPHLLWPHASAQPPASARVSPCSHRRQAALPAPPPPSTGGSSAPAGASAGSGNWSYCRNCTASRSVRYKIHGYEPSDLRPGWQDRLNALARHGGTCLVGAYARPGCVELTLDLLVEATATAMASLTALPGSHSAAGGQQPTKATVAVAEAQTRPLDARVQAALDVKPILDALGLDAAGIDAAAEAEGSTASAAALTAKSAAAADAQVQVQVLGMEPADAKAPRVAQLSPRVLLLPEAAKAAGGTARRGQVTRADSGSSSDTCEQGPEEWSSEDEQLGNNRRGAALAAAPPTERVLLRAKVCRPVGHDTLDGGGRPAALGAPAVFARGNGETLQARVTRFRSAAATAAAPAASSDMPVRGLFDGTVGACSCHCGAPGGCESYELEVLLAMPRHAGVVLVELAWDNQPGQVLPLLALPAAEAPAASELQGLAASADEVQSPAPVAGACQDASLAQLQLRRQQQLLSSFLLDAGVWAQSLAPLSSGPHVMRPPARQRAVLGGNLLRFSLHSGLRETEAWIARGLEQMERELGAAAATPAPACPAAPTEQERNRAADADAIQPAAIQPTASRCAMAPAAAGELPATATTAGACGGAPCGGCGAAAATAQHDLAAAGGCILEADEGSGEGLRRRGCGLAGRDAACADGAATPVQHGCGSVKSKPAASAGGGGRWALWLRALLVVLGASRAEPAEEAAYRAWVSPWETNQEHLIQAFECVALLALLFRARDDPLTTASLTTLLGGLPGAVTALGSLLLRREDWARLARAVKLPRYIIYKAAKVLAVVLNRPLPPGVTSYQLGLAMVLHEGLLLPLACLLPIRAAAVVTGLKILPCAAMMVMSGVAPSRLQASLRCAAVGVVALPTTMLCHTYLRVCFYRWRRSCGRGGGSGGRVAL